jgi:ABC-type multidrug transport system fused ATPase/permease subunit
VLAWYDWKMFLVVVCMAPILWVVNNHFRMKFSRLTRASQESFSRVTATLAESVNGIRVTQGFVRQDTNAGLFRSLLSDHSKYNVALARTSAVLAPILELNSQFFVATLLIVGGWRVFHGSMQADDLIMFFLLANIFFSPITIIGNQYNQGLLAMAGAERIFRLIDTPPDWEDAPGARPLPTRGARAGRRAAGARVEFRGVSSATTPRGSSCTTSTSRRSRARPSRSSATRAAGRARSSTSSPSSTCPTRGEVLVDGREIRTITGRSLHRQMGMVQQQNFLFSGSVLENIRLSRPEATRGRGPRRRGEARLPRRPRRAAGRAGDPGRASAAPGSRSASGSSCASCARFLADPRIVILDEATSSIDALTEARLQQALATCCAAHELRRGAPAEHDPRRDLVLVLDQGRIIERGTHPGAAGEGRPLRGALQAVCAGRRPALTPGPAEPRRFFSETARFSL